MSELRDQPLHASSSEAVTNDVRVEVESRYAPEHSHPFDNEWFFHYTVRISNEGRETVQLMSRHWIITDATGHVEEVRGSGVVGEQPVLRPGESFQYTSGCPLKTKTGVMRGTYQMVIAGGEQFGGTPRSRASRRRTVRSASNSSASMPAIAASRPVERPRLRGDGGFTSR